MAVQAEEGVAAGDRGREKLDEGTREVAFEELDNEAVREQQGGFLGSFTLGLRREKPDPLHRVKGDPVPEPVDDPDPGDERGLRDALRGDEDQS